jgi:ribosomal protein S14
MSNFIEKDKKRRNLVSKYELKRLEYQSIIRNIDLPVKIRSYYIHKLNNLNKNSCKIRIRNRCILTGRSRAVYRFCKISRIKLRELASSGLIAGIKKSSW